LGGAKASCALNQNTLIKLNKMELTYTIKHQLSVASESSNFLSRFNTSLKLLHSNNIVKNTA